MVNEVEKDLKKSFSTEEPGCLFLKFSSVI